MPHAESERASEFERAEASSLDALETLTPETDSTDESPTLASMPVGARLIVRCRADWREAVVSLIAPEQITLTICAPSGRTYRIKRPPNAPLAFNGSIPLLGEGAWRANLARQDARW
jgi:hypothetical protein